MTEISQDTAIEQTETLLTRYAFDLKGYSTKELIAEWLKNYQPLWIRLAVIEALYQGRYKAISVEQILMTWLRRGNPHFHFTFEFERLICRKLPRYPNLLELEEENIEQDVVEEKSANGGITKVSSSPIHEFTPSIELSSYYYKLKAVAQKGLEI